MRRLAVVLVLVIALAACGSDGGGGGGAASAPVLDVTFSPEPLRVGPVKWTVTITNDTSRDLELMFSSGKRADVLLSTGGEDDYQWSRGLMFTQELGRLTVASGDSRSFVLDEPGLEIDPGSYTLTAVVAAAGHPELRTTERVTVGRRTS